jgi:hypothetical protein
VSDKGIGGIRGMGYNLGHWMGWSMELELGRYPSIALSSTGP